MGTWRRTLSSSNGGVGGRGCAAGVVRGDGISVHLLRLFMVGTARLFCHPSAQDGKSALVFGNRNSCWHWPADEIHDVLLSGRRAARIIANTGTPFPADSLVLGWSRARAAHISAKLHLAGTPQFHFVAVPAP